MKRSFIAMMLSTAICTSAVHAVPYCDALMKVDTLPKKYKKKGPFYSDAGQGWIIAGDQLITDFSFGEEPRFLMTKIAEAFDARGIKLVLAVPPPRPLFMSAVIEGYDKNKATDSFLTYLRNITDTGVIAPDLLTPMQASLGTDAYFQRDTHWTPKGAAFAAITLAHKIGEADEFKKSFSGLDFIEVYSEKGSLTTVVDKVCETTLKPEEVMASSFSKRGYASDLLSENPSEVQKVALAGTSFSNRYNRDVYRFSDALSFALDAPVENHSISGGGIISALETLILSDTFQRNAYQTVIWEVPYTQSLSDIYSLRQILGALRVFEYSEVNEVYKGTVGSDWQSIPLSLKLAGNFALQIVADSSELKQVDVELYNQANEKTRLKLRKSSRVPTQLQSDKWTVSLEGLDISEIKKMKVRLKGVKANQSLSASLLY